MPTDHQVAVAVQTFEMLGDDTRLKILELAGIGLFRPRESGR